MAKRATYIFILILSVAMLGFTASRTIDLLTLFLPAGQEFWAWLGLAAFDIGLLGWTLFFAHGARGSYQRAIALMMVVLCLLAVAVSTVVDMYISASDKGLVAALPPSIRITVLLAVGLIVVGNVVAFFLTHIWEPERMKAMAEESANDKIHDEVLRQINEIAPQVAAQVAPILTHKWVQRTVNELAPGLDLRLESEGDVPGHPFRLAAPKAQNNHRPQANSARNGSAG
jgi:hypothetical protein